MGCKVFPGNELLRHLLITCKVPLAERDRPLFLRGDNAWGTEKAMLGAEERKLGFLFKLKQTTNVKKLIRQIFMKEEWEEAGQNWQGRNEMLRLDG